MCSKQIFAIRQVELSKYKKVGQHSPDCRTGDDGLELLQTNFKISLNGSAHKDYFTSEERLCRDNYFAT